ncbi:MAG TPA: HAMP domain-containing sensor histidine kinase [Mycobacteriales bacterium]|nr:HAMP domain-containing sensor histidine kinase [Mycobacteriales bacterium]
MSASSPGAWTGIDQSHATEQHVPPPVEVISNGKPVEPKSTAPRKHRRTSLRARVALLVAAAVGVAVALASLAAYFTVRHELRSHLDSNLTARAQGAAQTPVIAGLADNPEQKGLVTQVLSGIASDVKLAIINSTGQIASQAGIPKPGPSEYAVAQGLSSSSIRSITAHGTPYRVVTVSIRQGVALVLAESMSDTNDELNRMALVMLIVGVGGIVVAAVAGLGIAREGLRPVERLTAATEHIARTEDLTPIPVRGTDELARLTSSFNAMLGALGQSRERQRQLVADAGHELRTPLTSLRTNFDLLAQTTTETGSALSSQDRTELLADVRAQLEELSALVGDLVELARTDQAPSAIEPIDLSAVLDHALQRVRRRAPGITFDVASSPWNLTGDTNSLERAVTNLLDNAAKWSPPGGTVSVWLHDGILQVADQGPGIAEEDMPHVFERFYRATDARGLPGSGLGLSIVRQAAERHGGFVNVGRATSGGALLTMGVPGQPDTPH